MSTKFYVGQKDYIAKLNEADDAYAAAIAAAGGITGNVDTAAASALAAGQSATDAAGSAETATTQAGTSTTKAGEAAASAAAASSSANTSAGSAAQALAIYGTTNAMQAALNTAAAQNQLAQTAATSAGSVLQQDLSAISAALHRSPNAVTAQCIWDMSLATDGGAFIDRLQGTSIPNEALNSAWRLHIAGASLAAAETATRAISGAATGDFFQYISDGKIYKLLASSGTAQTLRGNTSKWPRLMAVIAEALGVFVYDLTAPGRPLWRHFPVGVNEVVFAAPTSLGVLQSTLAIGTASGLVLVDIAADRAVKHTTGADQKYKGFLATAGAGWN